MNKNNLLNNLEFSYVIAPAPIFSAVFTNRGSSGRIRSNGRVNLPYHFIMILGSIAQTGCEIPPDGAGEDKP